MGVRFIIGRAGSGKTRRCFEQIVKLVRNEPWGKPILWIVPKQATFEAERALTVELGAFARVRVFSFETFGEAVLEECGGSAVPAVSARGRQMILGWLLREMGESLQFFCGVAKQPGLIGKLDATFVELERCGKTPADLQADETADDALGRKISDLKKIYQAYLDFLGQGRFDPHRRLQEVLLRMEGCKLIVGSDIFIDGFLDYREYERQMIAGMAKGCAEMEITVLADPAAKVFTNANWIPDESELFFRTENAYRQLYFTLVAENIALDPPIKLTEVLRFTAHILAKIEQQFVQHQPIEPGEGLLFYRCENRRGEAMAAAAQAAALVAKGMRYRDVLVLSRDINHYADLLEAAFIEHGIPYFLDRRRTVAHHPLLQLLRGIFTMILHDWPHEAVMGVMKTGLVGLTNVEADELENYVLLHRIRGQKIWTSDEAWIYRRPQMLGNDDDSPRAEQEQAAASADRLRKRAVTAIAQFTRQIAAGTLSIREYVSAIFDLLGKLKAPETLTEWMKNAEAENDPEQKGEHEQVWNRLVELFEEMVELLGEKPVLLSDFAEILEAGLDSFDLALTPPTVDQVLVGQIDRTRSGQHLATILVGMNEGQLPLVATEDSILSDMERAELKNRKLELEGDSQQKRMSENLLAYLAMTRSSEQLILTRSVADEAGRKTTPSIYWRMLGNPEGVIFGPGVEDISTPTQAVARLIKWVRKGAKPAPVAERMYEWLRESDANSDVGKLRDRAWNALRYDNNAKLGEATAAALFRRPLVASVSQLETFAACPFKHFLRYGLGLEMREDDDPTAMDLGNLYHEALRKIVTATLREKLDWANLPEKTARDLVWNCTEEVGKELREELMISSARNRHLLGWIGRTLEKITAGQRAAARRGQFRPALAEMVFGSGEKVPALILNTLKGNRLELRGKIDRVDLHQAGRAFSVIDYKTSSKRLELDRVWHGLSLQLLIYMLVIQEHGEKIWGAKAEAAAGLYVELLRRLQSVDDPTEELSPNDPRFDLRIKPRGVVSLEFLQAFDEKLVAGESSDVLAVQIKKDGSVYASSTDVLRGEDIESLLNYVREKVAELADRILEGSIEAHPYRLGTETPCPLCDYRSICRFQPGVNRYLHVQHMDRNSVLEQMADKSSTPSPGTPASGERSRTGEGGGEGTSAFNVQRSTLPQDPHPNPLPEYRARGQRQSREGK